MMCGFKVVNERLYVFHMLIKLSLNKTDCGSICHIGGLNRDNVNLAAEEYKSAQLLQLVE